MNTRHTKWIILIVLALIWGSSFILIKKGLVGLSPYQLGAVRIIFAAIFLIAIGFKTLPDIPAGKWKFIALTSLFGTFVPAFLFAIAETRISSTIGAVLNSLTPVNSLLLGIFIFKLDYMRRQVYGVIIGLLGCLLLIFSGTADHMGQNYYYAFLVLIATMCYAINVNLIKKYLPDLTPLTITTGNFVVQLIPAAIILTGTGFFEMPFTADVKLSLSYILILGVIGTGVANIIFYRLIHISSPVFATSVTYLIPIVAFFWGMLDGEVLAPLQVLGAFVILVGVYLSSRK
jgi:drug/metabolite transporter (DMT)-like permease